jgi:hypothetical protein
MDPKKLVKPVAFLSIVAALILGPAPAKAVAPLGTGKVCATSCSVSYWDMCYDYIGNVYEHHIWNE